MTEIQPVISVLQKLGRRHRIKTGIPGADRAVGKAAVTLHIEPDQIRKGIRVDVLDDAVRRHHHALHLFTSVILKNLLGTVQVILHLSAICQNQAVPYNRKESDRLELPGNLIIRNRLQLHLNHRSSGTLNRDVDQRDNRCNACNDQYQFKPDRTEQFHKPRPEPPS